MTTDPRTAPSPDDAPSDRPERPPTIDPDRLAASRAIQRRTGKTFHQATRLFPKPVRQATYVLYGFVRIADEVVDGDDASPPVAQRRRLERLRAVALGRESTDHPAMAAFQTVRKAYGIRDRDVESFLDSMEADVDARGIRYGTPEALDEYVAGSAAAVGRMMTAVMGVDDEAAQPHAASLGAGFQLTNFLRDVREDLTELDRVYLPESALARHGASHEAIERLDFDDRVAAAVRDELRRAEERYRHGVGGIRYLPEGCQLPVLAAAVLYAEYHRVIRARDFDVITAQPTLGTARKLAALARTGYHWLRTRDPEAAFYAASAIPRVANEPAGESAEGDSHGAGYVGGTVPGTAGMNRGD